MLDHFRAFRRHFTNLHDGRPQLQVRLVHLRALPHVDLEVVSDEGEERGCERDPALLVDGHVHPDQSLVRHLVWTLLAKAQRRVNILQHLESLCVVDLTSGVQLSTGHSPACTYTPLGSNSAQEVMNSPRWWEPRMEESRVR